MLLYSNFCRETLDQTGIPTQFSLKYPENFNFGYDVVDVLGRENPDGLAVMWCNTAGEEKRLTYRDIMELSNRAANAFAAQGIRKGDRVLVILKRNWEYWYVAPALHKLGAVMIPATHLLTVEDLVYRIGKGEITAAVATPEGDTVHDLLLAQQRCPELHTIFVPRKSIEGCIRLEKAMEAASPVLERVETKVTDPMMIYFTSGTTGYPKAVTHNHTYPLSHIITARYWHGVVESGLHLTVAETGWAKASWGKLYGQWLCGSGVMVYDFDVFSPGKLLRVMEKYRVTTFCAPPTVYRYFVKRGMDRYDLSALQHLSTAGESLSAPIFRQVEQQTGLHLMEGFGQTETALILANFQGRVSKPGSMGKPSPMYQLQLQKEDGSFAGVNEPGEVVVIPPEGGMKYGIFTGYCQDDTLYQAVWRDGVYHTGDTATVDEDGYYWYIGRVDDLIKTKGFRVGPFEVENVLMEHPAVLECAVIGVPDEDRGQAIKAVVSLAAGYEPSPELAKEIREFCNHHMASYKWIQILEFNNEMPKTISGKIRRTQLRQK